MTKKIAQETDDAAKRERCIRELVETMVRQRRGVRPREVSAEERARARKDIQQWLTAALKIDERVHRSRDEIHDNEANTRRKKIPIDENRRARQRIANLGEYRNDVALAHARRTGRELDGHNEWAAAEHATLGDYQRVDHWNRPDADGGYASRTGEYGEAEHAWFAAALGGGTKRDVPAEVAAKVLHALGVSNRAIAIVVANARGEAGRDADCAERVVQRWLAK